MYIVINSDKATIITNDNRKERDDNNNSGSITSHLVLLQIHVQSSLRLYWHRINSGAKQQQEREMVKDRHSSQSQRWIAIGPSRKPGQ